jgi:hypothetical protein
MDLDKIIKMPMSKKIELFVFPSTGCESERASVEPFSVNSFIVNADQEYLSKLSDIVSIEGRPVQVDVCLNDDPDFKNCHGHVTVLSGVREKCCGKKCEKQFQLNDSMKNVWAKSEENGWITEKELLEKTSAFRIAGKRNLTWISNQISEGSLRFDFSIPQAPGQRAVISGIQEDSPEFMSGLRNGMNYGTHKFDSQTNEITVIIKKEDGTDQEFKYKN